MATSTLTTTLLAGLDVKSRADGTVHSVKGKDGSTVAEVCVGKKFTRLNLRQTPPKLPKGVRLDGRSKSWPAGGVILTDSNVAACRALLLTVTAQAKVKETKPTTVKKAPAAKATAAPKPVLAPGDTDNDSRSTAPTPPLVPTAIA
jgi:hypothetical protein